MPVPAGKACSGSTLVTQIFQSALRRRARGGNGLLKALARSLGGWFGTEELVRCRRQPVTPARNQRAGLLPGHASADACQAPVPAEWTVSACRGAVRR